MAGAKRTGDPELPDTESKRHKASLTSQSPLRNGPAEENAFIRGGGKVLSPLEQRRIQNEAFQDALLELHTDQLHTYAGSLNYDETMKAAKRDLQSPRTSKRPNRAASFVESGEWNDDLRPKTSPRIEGLGPKTLAPGCLVLGQVARIDHQNLTLTLPNNLVGYASFADMSDAINLSLTSSEKSVANTQSADHEHQRHLPRWSDVVVEGQYLRAVVISNSCRKLHDLPSKKRIELSIAPRQANISFNKKNITVNCMLQAAVASVEDHGLVMDLGLADRSVKGFIPYQELGNVVTPSKLRVGTIVLCLVTEISTDNKVVKMSAALQHLASHGHCLLPKDIPSIESLAPGAAIEFVVSSISEFGLCGSIMGLVDVTADLIHSGHWLDLNTSESRLRPGIKTKGRILWSSNDTDKPLIKVSLLPHILSFARNLSTNRDATEAPISILPISTVKDKMRVEKIAQGIGVFMDVGVCHLRGFAHISRLCDERIHSLSNDKGPYSVGTFHRGRVIGYNAMDGLFLLSLEPRILNLPFFSLEDLHPGQKAKAVVERLLLQSDGVKGVLARLTEGITGLIPETHFADIPLRTPERKFTVGSEINVRVLSVDKEIRRLRLTCKKTLVNCAEPIWKTFSELEIGMSSLGTIVLLTAAGAVLEFFGSVRGFLPASEISDSFIEDPTQHFRVGQTIDVRILTIDKQMRRMTLTCKQQISKPVSSAPPMEQLRIGMEVVGRVVEKTPDEIILDLEATNTRAKLSVRHLLDGPSSKCQNTAKRLRVGQILKRLMVLAISESRKFVRVTSKSSLLEAFAMGKMPTSFENIVLGAEYVGFVKEITPSGIFVQYAGELTGLLLGSQVSVENAPLSSYGMQKGSTIPARILSIDSEQHRFLLTQREAELCLQPRHSNSNSSRGPTELANPVDGVSNHLEDFNVGSITRAKIKAIKETQLNMELADGVFGRVDISQVFDAWDEIKDRKHPLGLFKVGQVLSVRVLGTHGAKNHRFLPITHNRATPTFELSAKPSSQRGQFALTTLDKISLGSKWICFVNNIHQGHLWVNLTTDIRGRIHAFDTSDDPSIPTDLSRHFPIGSALQATVLKVDLDKRRLDLSARSTDRSRIRDLHELEIGERMPGRVISVSKMLVKVRLNDLVVGFLHQADMEDDYSKANPLSIQENDIITVCIAAVDAANRRLYLSTRPSKILNSELPVVDREILSTFQLQVNDIVRGFVKNITNHGLYVSLSCNMTAFVRICDISDDYIQLWSEGFELSQLVKGRVIAVDNSLGQVRLSLKSSVLCNGYKPQVNWSDLKEGLILSGKVRKVESYGAFILLDNSTNISGLCHRSEMADEQVPDAKLLYEEGQMVRVKILKIDHQARLLSFGMKSSHIEERPSSLLDQENVKGHESQLTNKHSWRGAHRTAVPAKLLDGDTESAHSSEIAQESPLPLEEHEISGGSLEADPFDWEGEQLAEGAFARESAIESYPSSHQETPARGLQQGKTLVDRTAFMDAKIIESASDFERILLSDHGSSYVWLKYITLFLQSDNVKKAREIAQRALRTLTTQAGDPMEYFNIWVGFLNLEAAHGDEASFNQLFKRACQYNDVKDIHYHLASNFIRSGAYKVFKSGHVILV